MKKLLLIGALLAVVGIVAIDLLTPERADAGRIFSQNKNFPAQYVTMAESTWHSVRTANVNYRSWSAPTGRCFTKIEIHPTYNNVAVTDMAFGFKPWLTATDSTTLINSASEGDSIYCFRAKEGGYHPFVFEIPCVHFCLVNWGTTDSAVVITYTTDDGNTGVPGGSIF